MKLRKKEKTWTMAAAKAGLARNTARKYLKSGKLPSECRPERTWRTRPDPYESVWPEVEGILKRSPTVEATTVFDHLNRVHEGKFEEGQLRTLQRYADNRRTLRRRSSPATSCAGRPGEEYGPRTAAGSLERLVPETQSPTNCLMLWPAEGLAGFASICR